MEKTATEESPLFGPNNHSAWQITYREVAPEVLQGLKSVIGNQYASYMDEVTRIDQVNEAEINSNNFKVSGVQAGKTVVYLLRRVSGGRGPEEILRSHELMKRLDERGVPVPRPLLARSGTTAISLAGGWFTLFEFIDANHYRGTHEELIDAGRSIGILDRELTKMSTGYTGEADLHFSSEYKSRRAFSVPVWEDIFAKAALLADGEGEDSFAKKLLTTRDEIMNVLETLAKTTRPVDEKLQLMHFDLHPHNLLADGTKIVGILDFDSVRFVEKMRAVAFALHRAVRQYLVYTAPADVDAEVRKAKKSFLDAYRAHNALTEEEVRSIAYFIKDEALARLTHAMKEYSNTGVLVWKHDLHKQLTNIKEAEYFV